MCILSGGAPKTCIRQTVRLGGFLFPSFTRALRAGFFPFVSRLLAGRIHEVGDLKNPLMLSVSADYTKIDQKKHTEHERDVKNRVFDPGAPVYFRIFHGILGVFSCFSVVLAIVPLVL